MEIEIDIEIFYHSDETAKRKEAGMDYSVVECDTRIMTFYNIDCLAPYQDEISEQWFCKIFSGAGDFIATKNIEEIKKVIREKKQFEFQSEKYTL